MRVVGSFSALLVVAVLAAKPTFESVVKKFPVQTLPFDMASHLDASDAGVVTAVKLTAVDVKALGIENDALLKGKKSLIAHARVQRTGHELLFIRFEQKNQAETYLFSFSDTHAYLGAMVFHAQSTDGDVVTTNVSTITQAGALARVTKITRPQQDVGLPPECIVTAEQRGKVTSKGALELMPPFWSSRSGSYLRGTEELRVFIKRVFYRAKQDEPFVEMIGDGTNMRLPSEVPTWTLIWNERRSEISALTPSGDQKMFVRAW